MIRLKMMTRFKVAKCFDCSFCAACALRHDGRSSSFVCRLFVLSVTFPALVMDADSVAVERQLSCKFVLKKYFLRSP